MLKDCPESLVIHWDSPDRVKLGLQKDIDSGCGNNYFYRLLPKKYVRKEVAGQVKAPVNRVLD